MIFLIISLISLAFYMLYETSDKARNRQTKAGLYFHKNRQFTIKIALALILLAVVIGISLLGTTVSILYSLMILMSAGSFIIILYPIFLSKK